MSDNEDDKATVVLNLDELKKLKEQKDSPVSSNEIEFASPEAPKKDVSKKTPVILFDFKSSFFKENINVFPKELDCKLIDNLQDLNKELSEKVKKVVIFNYNYAPKAVNQLCAQIKVKFSYVNTMIIAKGLSAEKAKAHQESKSGANSYLAHPFSSEQLMNELQKIL